MEIGIKPATHVVKAGELEGSKPWSQFLVGSKMVIITRNK